MLLTAANVHDVTQLQPLVKAIPRISGKPGAPRFRRLRVRWERRADIHHAFLTIGCILITWSYLHSGF